ncbi:hypothetical protein EDB87DRAFT_1591211 [Lactarius vividus]|nr:hypothetical protein EDB87DRAFT_1591211 [Lactarius vividus]
MGTGRPLIMELPVIVSNWPRYVSTEAVRRISIAPSLGLQQPVLSMNTVTSVRPRTAPTTGQPATVTGMAHPFANVNDSRLANTMPNDVVQRQWTG